MSWSISRATGYVPEACQPPSIITTSQLQLLVRRSFFHRHLSEITKKYSTSSTLNRENKPQKGGICVANHTSPIDIVILANDGCYAMVSITDRWSLSQIPDVFYVMTSPLCAPSLIGGSDPWRVDGSHPEVHGEVMPSCLV